MEQVIKCTKDANINAVRLCDDCGLPFCAQCLRGILDFYYCQNCYPALFKDTSTQEYEIPIDEKGLLKIQSKIQDEVKIKEPMNVKNEVVIKGVFLAVIVFSVMLISTILMNEHFLDLPTTYFSIIFYGIIIISLIIYPYYGHKYGRRYPQFSWIIGIWLTLPLIILALIIFNVFVMSPFISLLGFSYLILSCIGAYSGARDASKFHSDSV